MTEQEIRALRPKLDRYLDRFLFSCEYTQTFDHLGTYVHGLLSNLERKTAEAVVIFGPATRDGGERSVGWLSSPLRSIR